MRHPMHRPLATMALLAAMVARAALAQTSPGAPTPPQVQRTPGGIAYLSGGAGEEERNAMAAQATEFPLKIVLSQSVGEYVVADRLSVITPQGELLRIRDAGPVVMIRLRPGSYTLEATWKDRTERRTINVGTAPETVNWSLPG